MTGETESIQTRCYPQLLLAVFWSTVVLFMLLILYIFANSYLESLEVLFRFIFFPGIILLTVLGSALIILATRSRVRRSLRLALILTGVATVGMPVFTVLHNLVYGLFIHLFGTDFWGPGGDEAFFFILALIGCPLLLIVSAGTAVVILIRSRGKLSA